MHTLKSLVIAFLLCHAICPLHAQMLNSKNNELLFNEGLLSLDQFAGIGAGPAGSYMSTPYVMTGAAFLTYRHYFSEQFAAGLAIGADNQKGDLSYGRVDHGRFGIDGVTGYYKRHVYTVAAEALMVYRRKGNLITYGYVGAGYTSVKLFHHFNNSITDHEFFYGTPSSLVPTNDYTVDFSHVGGQITPFGCRYAGSSKLSVNVEFGFGYKGIISLCMSYKFKKEPEFTPGTYKPDIVLLPHDYPIDSSMHYTGRVCTSNPTHEKAANFSGGIDMISQMATAKKGNVFQINNATDHKYRYRYRISGSVYNTPHLDSLKARLQKEEKSKFAGEQFATVTIYHTNYNRYLNWPGNKKAILRLNDTTKIRLPLRSKITLKITHEGIYSFRTTDNEENVDIDVRFGNSYYIHAYLLPPPAYAPFQKITTIDRVNNTQGELESSLMRHSKYFDLEKLQKH